MAKLGLPHVNTVRKRLANGKVAVYYYHRPTGIRLIGNPGSIQFYRSYEEAGSRTSFNSGTIIELVREYSESPQFLRKRESTKREYRRLMKAIEKAFGDMPIKALNSRKVRPVFIDYQERVGLDHPREADNRMTMLSTVLSYAQAKGRIEKNPLEGFSRMNNSNRSQVIWRGDDVARFMNGASIDLQRAMILALHTGQRYGDLVRLTWENYDGSHIDLKQSKTGQRVRFKCTTALKEMLDTCPRMAKYILTRANGQPWITPKDDKALNKAWTERMKECGLYEADPKKRLHFHDLRGTTITILAAGGASHLQIATITGHTFQSVQRILEAYTARTEELANGGIDAFERSEMGAFANRLQNEASAGQA